MIELTLNGLQLVLMLLLWLEVRALRRLALGDLETGRELQASEDRSMRTLSDP